MRGLKWLTFSVVTLMFSLAFTPTVLAETKWTEDGWLETNLAENRLTVGDEFGCYGIPGLEWSIDPGAVAAECRDYIESRTVASSGLNLLSPFTLRLCPDVWSHQNRKSRVHCPR